MESDQNTGVTVEVQARTRRQARIADDPGYLRFWPSSINWLVALLSTALGLFTGGYRIGVPPLWRDEGATKAMASRSVPEILATLPHNDVFHGAYYLIVHAFTAVAGDSNAALRFPSMIAMAIAAGFTAVVTRRLAALAGSPYAALTGLTAGALFALIPHTVRVAQEARSYAVVTMLAAISTYLLLRAVCDSRRWWLGYGTAICLIGLVNLFGLLLVVSHGVSLLIAAWSRAVRSPEPRARQFLGLTGPRVAGIPVRWLIAAGLAVTVAVPVMAVAYSERAAVDWIVAKGPVTFRATIIGTLKIWAGSRPLVRPMCGLVGLGVLPDAVGHWRGRHAFSPATVALPWLVMPPAVLLAISEVRPIFDPRYILYCLPALTVLMASGLTWLPRVVAGAAPPARWRSLTVSLAWLPTAVAVMLLTTTLLGLDARVRWPVMRADNLERESQIIASNSKAGDIVFYIPLNFRIVSQPFPRPWSRLRDIALETSPMASDTLYGVDVSPQKLLDRFTHVTRVWVISHSGVSYQKAAVTPLDREEIGIISRMKLLRRWRDKDTNLTLYQIQSRPLASS